MMLDILKFMFTSETTSLDLGLCSSLFICKKDPSKKIWIDSKTKNVQ